MAGKRYKSLYLPAFTIVATVLILLFVIAVSTYRNMDRESARLEETLFREARVIIYAVAAAIKEDSSRNFPDRVRLNNLLADMAQNPDIAGISLIDTAGRPVAQSFPGEGEGAVRGGASLDLLLREKGVVARYGSDRAGERTYEIIQPLRPFFLPKPPGAVGKSGPLEQWMQGKIIAVSFRLKVFDMAKREDVRHVILMGAILIILGIGTLYFIFIVQNYYRVDRTLGQIRTYTDNVVDSMADGLISLDADGRIVTMNRQAADILRAEVDAVKGTPVSSVLRGPLASLLDPGQGHIVRDREIEIERNDGLKVPLSVSAAPLKDETGREMGRVLLIKDLREIRELKEKVRRSEHLASLGRLAAGMAHEIRNPLSSIRGFAQFFLNRFRGKQEEEEYATIMVREVDRLNGVISELLDYAHPRPLKREPSSLAEIVEYAVKLLALELEKKKIVVERDYETELPLISADQEQLSQAVLNLLLNALQAVEEGGNISIELRGDRGQSMIVLTLADNGRGIPPEDLEKIFEPFFSTKSKGTGLGLAIVNKIVENHGGEITAENRPEGGTRFRISLPLQNPGQTF